MSSAPNWFPFHIGDYMRDAEELSMLQHGAYLGLMCWYYSTARPIPNQPQRVYNRLRASSVEERGAADFILGEFFVLGRVDNVWRHKRIDLELEEFRHLQDARVRGGHSNKARIETEKALRNNKGATAPPIADAGALGIGNHNHNHKEEKLLSSKLDDARVVLDYLNWKAGKKFLPTASNLKMVSARIAESSVDLCKQVVDAKVVEWGRDAKMRKYIRPMTIFAASNFGSYAGNDSPDRAKDSAMRNAFV